ncbi:uncharacterized protein FIBRA_01791 [Fibroporia radiculosa]|uniref:Uncharacterized protein n=1 Tax=Fibroporia radiculosa TaxID=599839 RepID=J4H1F4_9APHY|nr:uncharacterized protein FIBRA_01791 [Fibroporia radiculosa]CCL99769.1 predicted protein [Fibroporia radiculosa]
MSSTRLSESATQPVPSIAALPSLAHSLSSLATMTSVTKDMVHYGTVSRAKDASKAKLTTALERTKQRQGVSPSEEVGVLPFSDLRGHPSNPIL